MDIQERKFQTVSHCVDLENDGGKKVLVSVSICHISKCDGCDPSGEKGLHKPSCAWNILTNTCQVHEVKSRPSCPVHDAILPNNYVPAAVDRKDDEMTPDAIISCNDDGKFVGVTKEDTENKGSPEQNVETPEEIIEEVEEIEETIENNEETEEVIEPTDETKEDKGDPPEPPQDDGSGEFIPPADMITPDIPLLDASSRPYNVEDVLSVKADGPILMSEASNLTYGEMKTQNESNACSYVFVDRLDENLSTRLPTIITEALASSALNLKDDQFQIPDCFYEPYRKITALTLDKIQHLKDKILHSNETKAQASTEVYKIRDGDAVCIVKQVEEPAPSKDKIILTQKMVTIENPGDEKKEDITEFVNKCPVCEKRQKEIKTRQMLDPDFGEERVPVQLMNKKETGMAYECSFTNTANHPNASLNVQVQKIEIGEGEEIVHSGNSYNILNSPLTEIITTKKMNSLNVTKKSKKSKKSKDHQEPCFPPYRLCSNQETLYIEPPRNDMRSPTKTIDIKTLTNINDILKLQDTLKNKQEIKIDAKKETKDVALETDGEVKTENKCSCVQNKSHPCDHCAICSVNQTIQTEESAHKEDEEEEEEDEVLKNIEKQSKLYKKNQQPKGDENYKILSTFLQKVKQNAAEMSTVLKNQENQFDSKDYTIVRRKRKNQNELKRGDYGISLQEWEFQKLGSKNRNQKTFDYGTKLTLSPQIPDMECETEFQILETLKEEDEDAVKQLIPFKERFRVLTKPSLLIDLYKDIIRNSSFLKSLIPPVTSNGLFSDAVEGQLHEQKRSLIPWLISLFIPTCECMSINKGRKKSIEAS